MKLEHKMIYIIPDASLEGVVSPEIVEIVKISAILYFWVSGTFDRL